MAINRLIQGSLQSGLPKFDTVWDGRSAVGSMDPISAITLTSAQSSVQFNNIPQTYTHLQVRGISRVSTSNLELGIYLQMNSPSGFNYSFHGLVGNGSGSAATSFGFSDQTRIEGPDATGATALADTFGTHIYDILDYSNTNKFKTVRVFTGIDRNGGGSIRLVSGLFQSTNAITSLIFTVQGGANFVANTSFSLYGIR